MGNFHSCFYILALRTQTAKLIDSEGSLLRRFKPPMKAAEIMLEEPGYAVSPVEELKRTSRISAMKADDEILAGKVYVLVPVGRVHSKLSGSELVKLEMASKKKSRSKLSGSKVQPAVTEDTTENQAEIDDVGGNDTGFTGYQLANYRRWNPILEPISEHL